MCSDPFGGNGGGPFSDKKHYKIGSKVTALKIRIGGQAIDFIQVKRTFDESNFTFQLSGVMKYSGSTLYCQ